MARRGKLDEGVVTVTVPAEDIRVQLRRLIADGHSFEDAADKVVQPYRPSPVADFVWPTVRSEAHGLERQHHSRVEDKALGVAGRVAQQRARTQLPRITFRLGDGREVEWGKATPTEHRLRISWQRTLRNRIDLDMARHEFAVRLIEEYGVSCLDEIPGWIELPGWAELGRPDEEDGQVAVASA